MLVSIFDVSEIPAVACETPLGSDVRPSRPARDNAVSVCSGLGVVGPLGSPLPLRAWGLLSQSASGSRAVHARPARRPRQAEHPSSHTFSSGVRSHFSQCGMFAGVFPKIFLSRLLRNFFLIVIFSV